MLSWLMLSVTENLGIFGKKCEVVVVGNRLPRTLLIVSAAMRIWLSSGLVNSRIFPTLMPRACWHRLGISYADDLTLIAPSPAALRRLLFICEQFRATNKLKFNSDKTQSIKFSCSCTASACNFFCGKSIFVLSLLCT